MTYVVHRAHIVQHDRHRMSCTRLPAAELLVPIAHVLCEAQAEGPVQKGHLYFAPHTHTRTHTHTHTHTHAHTHTRTHARAHAHAHRHTQIQGKPGTGGPASITCAANRRAPCARELTPAGKLLTTKFVQSFVSHIIPLTRRRRPMLPSIAVAGGGPAGLMVALLLSRQGLRCAA